MAFILGIYQKILDEISKLNGKFILSLFNRSSSRISIMSSFFSSFDWKFIAFLLFGMSVSIILFVAFSKNFITQHYFEFESFIFWFGFDFSF